MNQIVKMANEIARMLGHACALTTEHASRLESFEALKAAWWATGIEYNDQEPTVPGITSWNEPTDGVLSWETSGRRMRVWVDHNGIDITLSRGPAEGEEHGADFLILEYRPAAVTPWFVRQFDAAAVEDRHDRLELVARLDRQLRNEILTGIYFSFITNKNPADGFLYAALWRREALYFYEKARRAEQMADAMLATLDTLKPAA